MTHILSHACALHAAVNLSAAVTYGPSVVPGWSWLAPFGWLVASVLLAARRRHKQLEKARAERLAARIGTLTRRMP